MGCSEPITRSVRVADGPWLWLLAVLGDSPFGSFLNFLGSSLRDPVFNRTGVLFQSGRSASASSFRKDPQGLTQMSRECQEVIYSLPYIVLRLDYN